MLADAFMAGIESVTSWSTSTRVGRVNSDGRPVTDADGNQIIDVVEAPMWNDKVACLTLFALGSSAPEILIACLGCFPNFYEVMCECALLACSAGQNSEKSLDCS